MAARYALGPFCVTLGLPAPAGLAAVAVGSGGTFAAGAQFWKVTGTNAAGETTGSNEATATLVLNGSANLTWNALPAGTTGVNVYRGATTGNENTLVATLGAVTSYTDTGIAGSGASPPAAGTAFTGSDSIVTGSLRDSAGPAFANDPGGFGTAAPVAGQTVTGVLFAYLATYPGGPQL